MSDAELIEWISQHLNDKLHNTEDCFTPEELTLVINLYSLLKASKRMDSELFTDFEKSSEQSLIMGSTSAKSEKSMKNQIQLGRHISKK